MKYRKEFKEQVLKVRLYSPYLYDKEIAEGYNISVSTLRKWVRDFYAEQNRRAEGGF